MTSAGSRPRNNPHAARSNAAAAATYADSFGRRRALPCPWHAPASGRCRRFDGLLCDLGIPHHRSWLSDPRVRDYLVARALRILPGLYICLIVTAFVIAPIGVAIQGGSAAKLLLSTRAIRISS